ncbi:MAG: exodeoxyribonuclease VII large subunit [Leptospirillia bacterium]
MSDPVDSAPLLPAREILSVAELTHRVRDTLQGAFGAVWLVGEVSNLAAPASGHVYLTLKDTEAQIRGVIWNSTARFMKDRPKNGDQVLCRGRITVYEPRGEYQLVIDYLEPAGVGALYRRIEALKAKLTAEGLLDKEIKKPLPALPQRVGIVTSATGAALHDVLTVLERRAPSISVLLSPTPVQGTDAPARIVTAIEALVAHGGIDALIVARGGGSLEDLMAFNDEGVARAIAACPLPVVAGVGHETDTTIADLVADVRAPTPSAAAEILSAPWVDLKDRIGELSAYLRQSLLSRLAEAHLKLDRVRAGLVDPRDRLRHLIQRVDDLRLHLQRGGRRRLERAAAAHHALALRLLAATPLTRVPQFKEKVHALHLRLTRAVRGKVRQDGARLAEVSGKLEELSPMGVLARGFALVRKDGRVLRSTDRVSTGDRVSVRLSRGALLCRVDEVHPEAEH